MSCKYICMLDTDTGFPYLIELRQICFKICKKKKKEPKIIKLIVIKSQKAKVRNSHEQPRFLYWGLIAGCVRRGVNRGKISGFLPNGYSRLLPGWWSRRFMREGLCPSNRRASQQDSRAASCWAGGRAEEVWSTTCLAVRYPLLLVGSARLLIINHRPLSSCS